MSSSSFPPAPHSDSKICPFHSLALADSAIDKPRFNDPIEVHARWIFEHIYRHKTLIVHGPLHASRVSHAVDLIHKIYLGVDLSLKPLSDDQLKLAQLAGLFHDMARETDGVDIWDLESAASAYTHANSLTGGSRAQSVRFDRSTKTVDASILLMTDLLHDADCLDIMRCNSGLAFNVRYLRLYERYSDHLHPYEFAFLRDAWFQLIHFQGDLDWRRSVKPSYSSLDCFEEVGADFTRLNSKGMPQFPLLFLLKTGGHRVVPAQLLETEIKSKSDVASKELRDEGVIGRFFHHKKDRNFTQDVEDEIRYAGTHSEDGVMIGNLNRCGSLLGKGIIPLGTVGFCVDRSVKVHEASLNDMDSGWGGRILRLTQNIHSLRKKLVADMHDAKSAPAADSLPQSALRESGHKTILGRLKLESELRLSSYNKDRYYFRLIWLTFGRQLAFG